ncbi:MAG: hypothetical protein IPK97_15210 [Ahniella sp.]|nr:hypothetical protein [Ahniella sp.]
MTGFAVQLDSLDSASWSWMLDFALAGLAFEHSFDLLLSAEAAAALTAETSETLRWRKQLDALRHHGLGQVLTIDGSATTTGYRHVFRF